MTIYIHVFISFLFYTKRKLQHFVRNSQIVNSHSYRNIDTQIGKTKITSNQLGYVSYGEHWANGFDLMKNVVV